MRLFYRNSTLIKESELLEKFYSEDKDLYKEIISLDISQAFLYKE
jgi:hypothetical protein